MEMPNKEIIEGLKRGLTWQYKFESFGIQII